MGILTAETAREYVERLMVGTNARISSVYRSGEEGLDLFHVIGDYDEWHGRSNFHWEVWIENGKLYGEW